MRVLLVRPWIHDFSAYDLWIQPLGLLYLGGVLAQNGFDLNYLARKKIGDDFLTEPLLQNHSYFPLKNAGMTEQDLQQIKDECNANNERIKASCLRAANEIAS